MEGMFELNFFFSFYNGGEIVLLFLNILPLINIYIDILIG